MRSKKRLTTKNHGVALGILELVNRVNGKIIGDFDERMKVIGTCAIEGYVENKITFVKNMKYGRMLADLQNALVFIPEDLAELCDMYPQNTYIVVSDLSKIMMDMQDFFYSDQLQILEEGISSTAKVHKSATIGKNVYIGENVCIGENTVIGDGSKIMHNSCISDNVVIGKRTYIHPTCTCEHCQIGDDCIIRSGARIGVHGFRFEQDIEQKTIRKMIHTGGVRIGNRVEISSNSVIQRATFEGNPTVISDDVKIACVVVVGHNTKIGARTVITCHTMIAGSNNIGEDVWIGAGAVISNGVTVGDRAKILINAVVVEDVAEDEMVSGFYAMPHRQWKRVYNKWKEEAHET
jgi:UDP-3-O-[3-hydroxymyristoyl] glucosamine N-acyltransferase